MRTYHILPDSVIVWEYISWFRLIFYVLRKKLSTKKVKNNSILVIMIEHRSQICWNGPLSRRPLSNGYFRDGRWRDDPYRDDRSRDSRCRTDIFGTIAVGTTADGTTTVGTTAVGMDAVGTAAIGTEAVGATAIERAAGGMADVRPITVRMAVAAAG